MTTDQFRVIEHYSYDIIGTLVYALTLDPLRNNIKRRVNTLIKAFETLERYSGESNE